MVRGPVSVTYRQYRRTSCRIEPCGDGSTAVTSVSEVRADYGAPYRENLAICEHEVRRQSLVESKEMVILMSREKRL